MARRGDEQWGEVEGRLIAEARAARLGVELEPWVARPLTELRAEAPCAQASQRLAANSESIGRVHRHETTEPTCCSRFATRWGASNG